MAFWAKTVEFRDLAPGAMAMLSHAAGNGYPERVLSTSGDDLVFLDY